MDPRIIDLESRLAFQEQSIDTLSDQLGKQAKEIARLHLLVEALHAKLEAVAVSNIASPSEETPPPHY